MPQDNSLLNSIFASSSKKILNLKSSVFNNNDVNDEINDHELAHRKAEEAGNSGTFIGTMSVCVCFYTIMMCLDFVALRRNEAAEWLREMDEVACLSLRKQPSEEEFCRALRNGLILCNVLNRVNPGAILKVVDNHVLELDSLEGHAHSAIQYFENMKNFLDAVQDMTLLTFEASDLEKVWILNSYIVITFLFILLAKSQHNLFGSTIHTY